MTGLTDQKSTETIDYFLIISQGSGGSFQTNASTTHYTAIASEFSVTEPVILTGFRGSGLTGAANGTYSPPRMCVWTDRAITYSQALPNSASLLGATFHDGLLLSPHHTYAVGWVFPPVTGYQYLDTSSSTVNTYRWADLEAAMDSPPAIIPGPGLVGVQSFPGAPLPDASVNYPDVITTKAWVGIYEMYYTRPAAPRVPSTQPAAPTVVPGAQQFTISNPWSYIPNIIQWEIQASTSTNGALWSDWVSVIINTGSVASYPHTNLNLSYLYRYRIRVRTQLQESAWTEPTFVGKPSLTG